MDRKPTKKKKVITKKNICGWLGTLKFHEIPQASTKQTSKAGNRIFRSARKKVAV